ncbi:MAG TPA: hypothetical protein VFH08_04990 [Chitinophagaceae bacterium]|nr:hypothetical protein [Chitinophagaceae bacterium]
MQSENFDKKIKDSLSQPPPGNDHPAWDKMEALLDKHMPTEKKDKRRFFFILLLFLFMGGGAFLIWQNNNGNKNNTAAVGSQDKKTEEPRAVPPADKNPGSNIAGSETETTPEKTPGNAIDESASFEPGTLPETSSAGSFLNREPVTTNKLVSKTSNDKKDNNRIAEKDNSTEKINGIPEKDQKPVVTEDAVKTQPSPVAVEKTDPLKQESQKPAIEHKTSEEKTETKLSQPVATEKSNSQKQANKKSLLDNLFFSVSAGPDFSTVGLHNAGKVQLAYGGGLGYQISERFSIRTGFYVARKVYSADPEYYDPPYNVWQYYPNLKNIDADCKVYEIPVTIEYIISQNKKQSWFVSGGLSSLIMKEETYDYYYKPNYSPTYVTYTKTINNENRHYFSVLNVSGGYTRNVNKNISLRAEPYMKIALDGVGLGKINLNSGGLLFSAIIKPFASKK